MFIKLLVMDLRCQAQGQRGHEGLQARLWMFRLLDSRDCHSVAGTPDWRCEQRQRTAVLATEGGYSIVALEAEPALWSDMSLGSIGVGFSGAP